MTVSHRRASPNAALLALLVCGAGGGCSAEPSDGGSPFVDSGEDREEGTGVTTAAGDGDLQLSPGEDGGAPTPILIAEETEVAPTFRSPVVTGGFLWSTNPLSGRVALIDAEKLTIRVLSAGLLPTYLAAVPTADGSPSAIVINVGSSDATHFRAQGQEIVSTRVPVHRDANRWAVSSSGRWAAAWSSGASDELDPTDGQQEVTLLDLSAESLVAQRVPVGYRPSSVRFDDSEQALIVVAEQGASLLTLGGQAARWVALAQGAGRDVSVTKDGRHALVRRSESSLIEIVPLDGSGDPIAFELPGPVTDLDLSESGRAVAVVRSLGILATFVVDDVIEDRERIDTVTIVDALVGSAELTSDGKTTVLYTNAVDSDQVTVVDLSPGEGFLTYRTLDTQTSVQSVVVSPDGHHALALGKGSEGASAGAFAVLSLVEERFPRVFGTRAPVMHASLENEAGVVTASSAAGVHEAHLVSLPGLHVEKVDLASPPVSAGILPDLGLGFAAQNHPDGRITFFEFGLAEAQTLTGFELSAEIVNE